MRTLRGTQNPGARDRPQHGGGQRKMQAMSLSRDTPGKSRPLAHQRLAEQPPTPGRRHGSSAHPPGGRQRAPSPGGSNESLHLRGGVLRPGAGSASPVAPPARPPVTPPAAPVVSQPLGGRTAAPCTSQNAKNCHSSASWHYQAPPGVECTARRVSPPLTWSFQRRQRQPAPGNASQTSWSLSSPLHSPQRPALFVRRRRATHLGRRPSQRHRRAGTAPCPRLTGRRTAATVRSCRASGCHGMGLLQATSALCTCRPRRVRIELAMREGARLHAGA
mmetsp:Transcript_92782/g.288838  ORF Transcript_92782/g.288838 Transcript_92782/m.288838 type:complete len:276 (-) Transcript_92782:469-1296(-)